MRASWTGNLRIGDVVLPVKLFSAVTSVAPHFVQLHAADHSPIRRITVCQQDGKELKEDDIVRAAEYEEKYVVLSDTDLERHTAVERDIVIRQFTDPAAIDSIYYEKPYYLIPGNGGELAYTILRQAFSKTKNVAVVTLVFYDKERIGVISVRNGILMFQILRFAEEIVPRASIRTPSLPQPSPEQVDIAARLMDRYSSPFHLEDYRNEHLDLLHELIERKAKGLPPKKTPAIAREVTPENEVTDKIRALLKENSTHTLT